MKHLLLLLPLILSLCSQASAQLPDRLGKATACQLLARDRFQYDDSLSIKSDQGFQVIEGKSVTVRLHIPVQDLQMQHPLSELLVNISAEEANKAAENLPVADDYLELLIKSPNGNYWKLTLNKYGTGTLYPMLPVQSQLIKDAYFVNKSAEYYHCKDTGILAWLNKNLPQKYWNPAEANNLISKPKPDSDEQSKAEDIPDLAKAFPGEDVFSKTQLDDLETYSYLTNATLAEHKQKLLNYLGKGWKEDTTAKDLLKDRKDLDQLEDGTPIGTTLYVNPAFPEISIGISQVKMDLSGKKYLTSIVLIRNKSELLPPSPKQ